VLYKQSSLFVKQTIPYGNNFLLSLLIQITCKNFFFSDTFEVESFHEKLFAECRVLTTNATLEKNRANRMHSWCTIKQESSIISCTSAQFLFMKKVSQFSLSLGNILVDRKV